MERRFAPYSLDVDAPARAAVAAVRGTVLDEFFAEKGYAAVPAAAGGEG